MKPCEESYPEVGASNPKFLELLDVDRDRAWVGLYRYVVSLLRTSPPRPLMSMTDEEREEFSEEFLFGLADNEFAVVRKYRDTGHSFAAWAYTSARNAAISYLRRRGRDRDPYGDSDPPPDDPDPTDEDRIAELRDITVRVKRALEHVGEFCQLLLKLASEELTLIEMTMMLGLPRDQNKDLWSQLRQCRRKLKKLLAKEGVDISVELGT